MAISYWSWYYFQCEQYCNISVGEFKYMPGIWKFGFILLTKQEAWKVPCWFQILTQSSDSLDTTKRKIGIEDGEDLPKRKVTKKKTRLITPTSEQLASLNLNGGRNSIVFTFSTPMLGKQQVVFYAFHLEIHTFCQDSLFFFFYNCYFSPFI